MIKNKYSFKFLLFLLCCSALLALLLLLYGSGSYPLMTPDEGRYATISSAMLQSGNWITPKLNGIVFMDKPILFYWLQATTFKLFGITTLSARILPAICGVFGLLVTFLSSHALYASLRIAWLASLILLSMLIYFLSAHYVDMNLLVAVLVSASLCCFLVGMFHANRPITAKWYRQPHRYYLWMAYTMAALAFLTKGLIGIVFPIMIVGLWVLLFHQWKQLKQACIPSGIVIMVCIISPWLIVMQHHNPQFFDYFFINQQFYRYIATQFNNKQPFYFYLLIIVTGGLPWSVFFIQAGYRVIRKWLQDNTTCQMEGFLLIWVLVVLIFFSIPASKTIGYILPVFIPLAILTASYLDSFISHQTNKRSLSISFVLLIIIALAFITLVAIECFHPIFKIPTHSYPHFIAMAGWLILGLAVALYLKIKRSSLLTFLMTTTIITLGLYLQIVNTAKFFVSPTAINIATAIQQRQLNDNTVVMALFYNEDLPFYLNRSVFIAFPNWYDPQLLQNDNEISSFAKGLRQTKDPKTLINFQTLQQKWQSIENVLLIVDQQSLPLLPITIKQHYRKIASFNLNRTLLISNH